MTDIETKEAMRASWNKGWEEAKAEASDAMRKYQEALHIFISEDNEFDGWMETGGCMTAFPLIQEWTETKQRLAAARKEFSQKREALDNYLLRMEKA